MGGGEVGWAEYAGQSSPGVRVEASEDMVLRHSGMGEGNH